MIKNKINYTINRSIKIYESKIKYTYEVKMYYMLLEINKSLFND